MHTPKITHIITSVWLLTVTIICHSCSEADKESPITAAELQTQLCSKAWASETERDYFITGEYADKDLYYEVYYFFSQGRGLVKCYSYTYDYVDHQHSSSTEAHGFDYTVTGTKVNITFRNQTFAYSRQKLIGSSGTLTPRDKNADDADFIENYRHLLDKDWNPDDFDYALSAELFSALAESTSSGKEYTYIINVGIGAKDLERRDIVTFGVEIASYDGKVYNKKETFEGGGIAPSGSGAYLYCLPQDNSHTGVSNMIMITSAKSSIDVTFTPKWENSNGTSTSGQSETKTFTATDNDDNNGNDNPDLPDPSLPIEQQQDILDASSSRRGLVSPSLSGSGTQSDPYRISSAADLRLLSDMVRGGETFRSKYVQLEADITINSNVLDRNGNLIGSDSNYEHWIPIGRHYPSHYFCGVFRGNGHTISGIYYNRPDEEGGGLFGYVSGNAIIADLTIKDSYICGGSGTGAIVGTGTIQYVSSTISAALANYYKTNLHSISIRNCRSYATVSGQSAVGGIAGNISLSTSKEQKVLLYQCANFGKVRASGSNIGGVIGQAKSGTDQKSGMTNCANLGTVECTGTSSGYVAGIAGQLHGMSVENCVNNGTITAQSAGASGIIGLYSRSGNRVVRNNVSCDASSTGIKAGVIYVAGTGGGGTVSFNYFLQRDGVSAFVRNDNCTAKNNEALTEQQMKSAETLQQLNKQKPGADCAWVTGADGFPTLEWTTLP